MTLTFYAQEMSNQHFWHSEQTQAKAARIWNLWTDVSTWKDWDTGLKNAEMAEAFQLDAKGVITSLEGRKSKFKVVAYVPGKSYTIRTKLPLGNLYVKRYLREENNVVIFTHEVWFSGLTKGLFATIFGGKFRTLLPEVLTNIKTTVENGPS